jgi:phenylalanine ammonia-lyase
MSLQQALPLEDALSTTCMPEAWVRASLIIRLRSLLGGFSAVRPAVPLSLAALLNKNITPLVPIHGSISASGDLMPLAYIGGVLIGRTNHQAWIGDNTSRHIVSAKDALRDAGIEALKLEPKEGLAIVNGTACSCAVAALAMHDAHGLAIMAQILTAMTVEALHGTDEYFHPFIGEVRPHSGQVSD